MVASRISLVPQADPTVPDIMVTVSIVRGAETIKTKCAQSRDAAGIEHLIEVVFLGFRTHAVERLGLNGPESFRLFSDVLNGEALLQWQRLLATLYVQANRRTPQGFIRA